MKHPTNNIVQQAYQAAVAFPRQTIDCRIRHSHYCSAREQTRFSPFGHKQVVPLHERLCQPMMVETKRAIIAHIWRRQ